MPGQPAERGIYGKRQRSPCFPRASRSTAASASLTVPSLPEEGHYDELLANQVKTRFSSNQNRPKSQPWRGNFRAVRVTPGVQPAPDMSHAVVKHGAIVMIKHGAIPTIKHGPVPTIKHGAIPSIKHGALPTIKHGAIPSIEHSPK